MKILKSKNFIYLVAILVSLIFTSCIKQNADEKYTDNLSELNFVKDSINDMTMVSEYGFDVSADSFDVIELGSINNKKIKWFLIDKTDKTATLISKDVLEIYKYYLSYSATDWNKSDIRFYLNNEFYNKIFDESEKEKILLNEDGDKISLLTLDLLNSCFGFINNSFGTLYQVYPEGAPNQKLIAKLMFDDKKIGFNNEKHFTDMSSKDLVLNGLEFDEFFDYANNCVPFWLKDMGNSNYETKIVDSLGYLSSTRVNSENIGIRPVITISIE